MLKQFYKISILLLLAIELSFSTVVKADIYQWKDKNGKVHFSDALPESAESVKKLNEKPEPAIKGGQEDTERNQEQAKSWYKERLKQSKKEDKEAEIVERAKKREIKKQRKKCQQSRKKLEDKKAELKARKRAGIRPRIENQMEINIEMLERDVDYYC